MFTLPPRTLSLVKGVLYVIVGLVLGLSAFEIISGSIMHYFIAVVALYFIGYGLLYSGVYHKMLAFINKNKARLD